MSIEQTKQEYDRKEARNTGQGDAPIDAVLSQHPDSSQRLRKLVVIAMLSAIAFGLAFLEFPVPLSPAFARYDFSDIPALIAAFSLGPFAGVCVELIKNLLQLMSSSTGGIGELANFVIGVGLVLPAGLIYRKHKTRKTAVIGCTVGSVIMAVDAGLVNYFILIPMFNIFMPIEEIIAAFGQIIPFIHTKADVILYNCVPFNLIKGAFISLITILIYKRISPILKGRH